MKPNNLQKACVKLQAERDALRVEVENMNAVFMERVLDYRCVETACKSCSGFGVKSYGNTTTWRGGIGGQAVTPGVCDKCWGSGDENEKWLSLKRVDALRADNEKLRENAKDFDRRLEACAKLNAALQAKSAAHIQQVSAALFALGVEQ